ncbi:hypothetical protein NQ133_07785 [Klebsiella variicola]|nr:hypothetical protein [Klebsiella variicola]MDL3989252.1 hypothetical protein [Klebsiella variicola]
MADTLAKQFVSLSSYFFFGSLLATSENIFHRLKEITIFSLVIYLFAKNTIYSFLVEPVAFSSVVIVFCTGVYKEININKIGDLSYGMYIYHFPIIQTLQYMGVYDENPLAGVLATILLTLSISYASWHLLENRFLKRTNYATQRVNQSNTSIS